MELALSLGICDNGGREEIRVSSSDPHLQLHLLPFSPVPRIQSSKKLPFPWLDENLGNEPGVPEGQGKRLDVKRLTAGTVAAEEAEETAIWLSDSPPSSGRSSLQLDFGIVSARSGKRKRDDAAQGERSGSRASDDDENWSTRKKLRLSKEQSAFLEHSFKQHSTLNPKEKFALAKELNLRPRQVEVWFQNRRARTKLKQTEVDCEYLKRCCETLTEENRRLQKEIQELRALKTSRNFYMQLPATTLTMCPSCERLATEGSSATTTMTAAAAATAATAQPAPVKAHTVQVHQAR